MASAACSSRWRRSLEWGEDRPVQRPDDQRGDATAAEPPQQPVEQDQRQQDEDEQRGKDDPDDGPERAALDDPRPRPFGEGGAGGRRLRRVRDEGPEGAAAEDRQQRRQQGQHRERRAGDAHRGDRAEPGGAVDRASSRQKRAAITVAAEAKIAGPGRDQRRPHRLVLVDRAMQLLAIAGDEQQRVVGTGAEYEDRHDRARLAVDGDAELGQAVAERAREGLGEEHRHQRDQEEDRRAVDDDQQEDHEADRGEQQGAVDAFEDFDRVGREAGAAGHLRLQPAFVVGQHFAPVLDRVEDPFALAVALDVGGDDRGLAVGRAEGADEGFVAGRLPRHRGRAAAAGRHVVGSRARFHAAAAAPAARSRGRSIGDDAREAPLGHLADVFFDRARSAAVSPDSRRKTITAGASSPFCSDSVACSAAVDSASPGR